MLLTNILPSDPNKLNLDSYSTVPLSTGYALWWSQDEHLDFSLKSKVCDMESELLIFPYLTYEKQFFLVIGFPVCTQNAQEIKVAVLKWYFKDILTIIRSSCLVVIGGLPVLGFWFKCPVSLKSTDHVINNAFWPSHSSSNFRIRFAFFMIC